MPKVVEKGSLMNHSGYNYNFITDTHYERGTHGIRNIRRKFPGIGQLTQKFSRMKYLRPNNIINMNPLYQKLLRKNKNAFRKKIGPLQAFTKLAHAYGP